MSSRPPKPFSDHVSTKLGAYVYRLLDPRNGETFYVGKGSGNRVFQHVAQHTNPEESDESAKLARIRAIKADGFEVGHVIHRHGMSDAAALEVEAALIEAYLGLSNVASGHNSSAFGVMHVDQVIRKFESPEAEITHSVLMINVNVMMTERSLYDAVRHAWRLDVSRARQTDYILATQKGMIIGAFVADEWLPATEAHFPGFPAAPERWAFRGREAPQAIRDQYIHKRVPELYTRRGAANPIKYAQPDPRPLAAESAVH